MLNRFVGSSAEVVHHVYIENSATGAGRTGLAHDTSGLIGGMMIFGSGGIAVTFETIATLGEYEEPSSDAHVRFKEIDASNLPGFYEIHLPLAYFASTGQELFTLVLRGAANMKQTNVTIQKNAPVAADGLMAGGIPVLDGTSTTITLPQLDLVGADGAFVGVVVVVEKGDGSQPDQIGTITSSVVSSGQTLCGIITARANGQWWWTPGAGDKVSLKLTASPLVLSPQQIADYVCDEILSGHSTAGSLAKVLSDSADQLDLIQDQTDLITAAAINVTVVSPVRQSGSVIEIVQGDDYSADDDREISFTATDWPDLTGATVTIYFKRDSLAYSAELEVITPTGTAEIMLELESADTTDYEVGDYAFQIKAVLSPDSTVATLIEGVLSVTGNLA